ncbi:MAG TPA: SelL-related redox protein [Phycisphaerae bacterium]|nr:SelL-related redox protein [Phycisphaerae bacterium]
MVSREGSPACKFALTDAAGHVHRLEDYAGSWLLLVFHRHLGCLPCREHITQLREHEDELAGLGVKVLVIAFEAGPVTQAYVGETNLRWPLLVDESRELYVHYGMLRASWWRIWGPATLWAYAKLFLRGRRPRKSGGDVSQLGGDVLIDPNGVVALQHVEVGPADRPAVEAILDVVRARNGTD